MEDILNSWSPTGVDEERNKSFNLARIRDYQCRFDEAEHFYLDALSAYSTWESNGFSLLNQVNYHVELLLRQARSQDASRVFVDCLSLFDEWCRGSEHFEDWSICIDSFRVVASKLESEYEDFDTQRIIEQLDVMSLTDHNHAEIDADS
jgi:hypothetical protein